MMMMMMMTTTTGYEQLRACDSATSNQTNQPPIHLPQSHVLSTAARDALI